MSEKEGLVNANTTLPIAPNFVNARTLFITFPTRHNSEKIFTKKTYVEFSQRKKFGLELGGRDQNFVVEKLLTFQNVGHEVKKFTNLTLKKKRR